MPVILSAAVPVFESMMVCTALLVPTACEAKVKLLGARVAAGVPVAPVPVSETICGLPLALSAIEAEAVRVPVADGSKVTLIEQKALAAMLVPQVFVWVKSPEFVPVMVMPEMLKDAVPVLVTVMSCPALVVPTVCDGKVKPDAGEIDTADAAAAPVPVSAIACGLPIALSAMETEAVRTPDAVGSKVTLIVQVALAARLVPHVSVCEKSPASDPVIEIPEMFRAVAPFVSVMSSAVLVVPTVCDANVRLEGEKLRLAPIAEIFDTKALSMDPLQVV